MGTLHQLVTTHEVCTRCGNLNGAFEKLGSGVCNECLRRSVAAHQAAQTRAARRAAKTDRAARRRTARPTC